MGRRKVGGEKHGGKGGGERRKNYQQGSRLRVEEKVVDEGQGTNDET